MMLSDTQVLDYLAQFDAAVGLSAKNETTCQVSPQTIEKIARFLNTTDYGATLSETLGLWTWGSLWSGIRTSNVITLERSVPADAAKVDNELIQLDQRTQARVFLTSFDSIVSGQGKCKVNPSTFQVLNRYSRLLDAGYDPHVQKEQLLLGLVGTWAGMSQPDTDGGRVQIWIDLLVPYYTVSVEGVNYPLSGYTPLSACATDLVLEF